MNDSIDKNFLNNAKEYLLKRKRQLEESLRLIDKNDPVFIQVVPEASELGTDSWISAVHSDSVVLKNNLLSLSEKIKRSLFKLNAGTYGRCDKCGNEIEHARLQAIPMATLCMSCNEF